MDEECDPMREDHDSTCLAPECVRERIWWDEGDHYLSMERDRDV